MRTVWKYEIPMHGVAQFELLIPVPAKVVHVEMQGITPTMWIELNPESPSFPKHFSIVGTGHQIPVNAAHVGSWQMEGGRFVFHLYEHQR